METRQLSSLGHRLLRTVMFCVGIGLALSSGVEAAVGPNGQPGACGPYYLWYQVSPDPSRPAGDYVELCRITFDITDVLDDFNFVHFTDTDALKRAALDTNQDGISDQDFFLQYQNILEWKPESGCVRINLAECAQANFSQKCGYAMIGIQPKAGFRSGSVRIPVRVTKKCPPTERDCSETVIIVHDYSNCEFPSTPNFLVHQSVKQIFSTSNPPEFEYTIIVQNTSAEAGDTLLTETITGGSNGGTLVVSKLNITCPRSANCTISSMTDEKMQISIAGLPATDSAKIEYTRKGNSAEIAKDEVSYFTSLVTLSNGNSSQTVVGFRGQGDFPPIRRPERPRR